jgi:hypothetical protein
MPPVTALPALGTTSHRWEGSDEFERLRIYVEGLARQQGLPSDPAELLKGGYEALPRCLPLAN